MGWVVRVTPRPRITPAEWTPGTHWIRGWVGPRAGLDNVLEERFFCLCWGSNLDCSIVQSAGRHCADLVTPPHNMVWYGMYGVLTETRQRKQEPVNKTVVEKASVTWPEVSNASVTRIQGITWPHTLLLVSSRCTDSRNHFVRQCDTNSPPPPPAPPLQSH
jgi:hypothetical protein